MAQHSVQTKENNALRLKQPDVRMLTDWKPKRWLRPNHTVCSGFAPGIPTCVVELWAWVRVKGVAQCRMLRRSPRGDTVDAGIGFRLKSQGNKKYSHNLEGTEFLPQSLSGATEPKQVLVFGWFQRHGQRLWTHALSFFFLWRTDWIKLQDFLFLLFPSPKFCIIFTST